MTAGPRGTGSRGSVRPIPIHHEENAMFRKLLAGLFVAAGFAAAPAPAAPSPGQARCCKPADLGCCPQKACCRR